MSKRRLIEHFILDSTRYEKLNTLTEGVSFKIDGSDYKARGAFRFKIWLLDKKNLNGRIYKTELAQQVIKENKVTLSLMNHPKESDPDGDITSVFAVARNPQVIDGWLCVDNYLVGDYGQLVLEILEAKGPLGVSSSALGDLSEITGEVLLQGFELERYNDAVLAPSNNYNQEYDESVIAMTESTKSFTIEESVNPPQEDLTILNSVTDTKEPIREGIMSDKISEKGILLNIKTLLKEADSTVELYEKLESYKEIKESIQDIESDAVKTLSESISEKIKATEEGIRELAMKGKNSDELFKALEESKAKIADLEKTSKELSEKLSVSTENHSDVMKKYILATELLTEARDEYGIVSKALSEKKNTPAPAPAPSPKAENNENKSVMEALLKKKKEVAKLKEELATVNKELSRMKELRQKALLSKKTHIEAIEKRKVAEVKAKKESEKLPEEFMESREKLEAYYNDLVKQNPQFARIKTKILESKTVEDAQIKAMRFENKMDDREAVIRRNREIELTESTVDVVPVSKTSAEKLKPKGWF